MSEARMCQNCGAPLHGNKCEYCGTEYKPPTVYIETFQNGTEEIAIQRVLPMYVINTLGAERAAEIVKHEMAQALADEMCKYMDVDTYLRIDDLSQVFCGRIRVVMR